VKSMPMYSEGGLSLGRVKGTTERRRTTYKITEKWNK